ncbi:class 1 fructose-bisphosphatase [Campylobacter avium]|uniref:class 1 fructose-bisphosphatase n=1 Tax=Campylobacter avium TaxID=522485 RepID=UPI0023575436|nr:class 1 fructose-bisphosphatase [Campylobacter avium]
MKELIKTIQKAVLEISKELKNPDTSYSSGENATGDKQLKLDVKADLLITEILSKCPDIKALISEEKDEALILNENAKFIVAYDPLDGSSLLDVNFSVGSIFAIYENEAKAKNLKAAAYSIYGPRLEFVLCAEKVELFRYKDEDFAFVKELKMSEKGKINASGGTQKEWSKTHADFIKSLFDEGYRLRYSGAMVSDIHQILCKGGGIFSYPATKNSLNGKLRAFFEVFPLAFIMQKAGGFSTDGFNESLLDLHFDDLHATTPCFFGSSYEIEKLKQAYKA